MTTPTSRRSFLAQGAVLAAGSAGIGAGCAEDAPARPDARAPAGSVLQPFRGDHQAGVLAPPAAAGVVAGLSVHVEDRAELIELFRVVSAEIEHVMSATAYERRAGGFPPLDTGILGATPGATGTSMLLGVGPSLFDDRFGLRDGRPAELIHMPKFANDYLVDPKRSHGDLSLTIQADTADAAMHALRQVLRRTRGELSIRWMREGYNSLLTHGPGEAPVRNLMGFRDGTANLDTGDADLMDRWVWIQPEDGQPAWATGGTFQAVRVIRMMVEFWDRTRLSEQESLIGRHRDSGAPLGGSRESDPPTFGEDLRSHIARVNARHPDGPRNLMLRRPFSYVGGVDDNEQLDQGLLFTCYQRSLAEGFLAVQARLDGEALEEYIRPLGGGFFVVLPGPGVDGRGYVGASLLEG